MGEIFRNPNPNPYPYPNPSPNPSPNLNPPNPNPGPKPNPKPTRYNSGMGEIFRKVAAITPVLLRGEASAASLPPPAEECDADAAGAVPVATST